MPPGELIELAKFVRTDVRLAILALVPCVSLDELDPDEHPCFEEDLVTRVAVRQFVATLSPADQSLVDAIFWLGIPAVDIARVLGVSESAISQRLARIYRLGRIYFGDLTVAA